MTRILKKLLQSFKECELYKVARYVQHQYLIHEKGLYQPSDFAIFEESAHIDPGVQITHPKNVVVREGSVIHRGTFINSIGGLHLGRYSGIGYNCRIFTADHKIFKVSSIPFDKSGFLKPVYIDDFVIMGSDVRITPGVCIGEGAIIGMGSVITRDVPPLAIIMHHQADPVAYRDKRLFEQHKNNGAVQNQTVEEYNFTVPLMYRKKYHNFLSSIGLDDSNANDG